VAIIDADSIATVGLGTPASVRSARPLAVRLAAPADAGGARVALLAEDPLEAVVVVLVGAHLDGVGDRGAAAQLVLGRALVAGRQARALDAACASLAGDGLAPLQAPVSVEVAARLVLGRVNALPGLGRRALVAAELLAPAGLAAHAVGPAVGAEAAVGPAGAVALTAVAGAAVSAAAAGAARGRALAAPLGRALQARGALLVAGALELRRDPDGAKAPGRAEEDDAEDSEVS